MAWTRRRGTSTEPLDRQQAYDAAAAILALRSHLEGELARKLTARGTPADVLEDVLGRLRAERLLDDEAVARRFANEAATHRHWGGRRIQAELRQRGASAAVADAALEELGDPIELAQRAAARWARRQGGKAWDEAQVTRLARHLSGLGHSTEAIARLISSPPGGEEINS